MDSSHPISGHICKGIESRVSKRYLYTLVYGSINHNSQQVKATQVSIGGGVNRMWSIHTMEY